MKHLSSATRMFVLSLLATSASVGAQPQRPSGDTEALAQGPTWAMGAVAVAAAATLIFVLPARAPTVNRARTDPVVSALERWASPMPLASELRESALEALELDSVEEGEL